MIYVLGSEDAKAANMSRFDYFMEVAEGHRKEFKSLLAQTANGLAETFEIVKRVEHDCLWVLGQIKRREDVNFDLKRCFIAMRRAIREAYTVFSKLIPEELSRAEDEVACAYGQPTPSRHLGSIENLRFRLSVQSVLLARHTPDERISTIAHDSAQSYSLHYFLIDYRLLSEYS
jgi:hypothetical protein